MPYFNESQLEMSIVTLLQEQGYDYVKGEDIVRNLDEVVLRDDLAQYLPQPIQKRRHHQAGGGERHPRHHPADGRLAV